MANTVTIQELELRRLVRAGVLTRDMNYEIALGDALLTFCNRLEGRMLYAEIAHDQLCSTGGAFVMIVTERVDGRDVEVISIYRHSSLEHLIRVGKGFLCFHGNGFRPIKRSTKAVVTVRVEEELKIAFGEAASAIGESQSAVLRKFMCFLTQNIVQKT